MGDSMSFESDVTEAGLFESMEEHHAERLAIMQESNVTDAVGCAADDLHHCEVKAVVHQCYPDGNKAAKYFDLVEKKRGSMAAQKLRDDVRAEWKRRKIEEREGN